MAYIGFAWECECGHIEYAEKSPEECLKCHRINSFTKLPEEIIDERLKDKLKEK